MTEDQTCGKGLAEHSRLPATMADLLRAMAETLDAHKAAIDTTDQTGTLELEAYTTLSSEFHALATALGRTAALMAGYRDLPMARHDTTKLAAPAPVRAFERFVAGLPTALRAAAAPLLKVALSAHDVVRLLQPRAKLAVQVGGRCDADVVPAPARTVVDRLDDSPILNPAMEGERGHEVILARIQTGESDAGDGDETGLLGEHLDVAERFEQRDVLARRGQDPGRGAGKERLEREPAARVPEIAGDEARAAFRAVPQRRFRHSCKSSHRRAGAIAPRL